MQQNRSHQLPGAEMQTIILHLAVRLFKTSLLAGQGHQTAGFGDRLVTQLGGDALLRTPRGCGVLVTAPRES